MDAQRAPENRIKQHPLVEDSVKPPPQVPAVVQPCPSLSLPGCCSSGGGGGAWQGVEAPAHCPLCCLEHTLVVAGME